MSASIELLVHALRGADRTARYQRYMQTSFRAPVKSGGVLWQMAERHREDAEKAEALALDYRTALKRLGWEDSAQ